MFLRLANSHYFSITLILLLTISVNQYFGFIGVNPIDGFIYYHSGNLILNGQLPFKDFWITTGPLVSFIQYIIFKINGVNWNSYVLHASLFNFFLSYFIYFTFKKFKLKNSYCLLYALLTGLIFYPITGTPAADIHGSFFSIASLLSFILAINFKNKVYWALLPIFLILGFLSKQTPVSYFGIIIFFLLFYNFLLKKNLSDIFVLLISSSLITLIICAVFYYNEINYKDFYLQYIKFASSIGKERIIDAGYLQPFSFSRYFLKFKLIHFSYLILAIILISNLIKIKRFWSNKDFISILAIIFSAYCLIVHQLLTLNAKFIYFCIPLFCGFSQIFLKKYFTKHKKIFEILILILAILGVSYNFHKYVYKRGFIIQKSFDKDKIFETKIIDQKSDFKWITNYSNKPKEEVKNIITSINNIKFNEKDSNDKYVIITDYQFIFSSFDLVNAVTINNIYVSGITYPLVHHQSFPYYKQFFMKKIKENKVKKIYFIKPMWFQKEEDKILDGMFDQDCVEKINLKNVIFTKIKNC